MTRKVIGTAIITLACLFLAFSYGIGVFGFLFPRPMLGLSDSLGLTRASAMFAYRVHARNPDDIGDLRIAIERAFVAQWHGVVVGLAPKYIEYHVENEKPLYRDILQMYMLSRLALGLEIGGLNG